MTIKKKIVIWYTIWMTVLVIVAALILFSLSGVMVERSSIRNLEEVVHDAAEDVWVRDGRVRTDDLDYFDDGVYISIWNGEELIEGRFPEDAPWLASSCPRRTGAFLSRPLYQLSPLRARGGSPLAFCRKA